MEAIQTPTPTTEQPADDGLEYGLMSEDETMFVLDTISKSFRSSPYAGVVPNHMWHPLMKATLAGLLERGAKVLVARSAGRVVGYVMYETKAGEPFVSFVYVKDHARRLGVGKALLTRAGVVKGKRWFYTFRTKASVYLTRGHIAVHAPEAARRLAL